mmetsp:Transcript_24254/g.36865  ORF Transcript_24254/g.36865 Transcript_24254/m.36865 type:complete len:463 (-) Transcript_24254:251-1639(-)
MILTKKAKNTLQRYPSLTYTIKKFVFDRSSYHSYKRNNENKERKMGKKRQKNLKKRVREAREEQEEAAAHLVETQHVVQKPNEELFVLDRSADPSVSVSLPEDKKKKKKKGLSHVDQKKVEELLKEHSAAELSKLVSQSKQQIKQAKKKRRTLGSVKPGFDLWGDNNDGSNDEIAQLPAPATGGMSLGGTAPTSHVKYKPRAALKQKKPTLAIELAHAGQSYHPDSEHHQDAIGEALALELRRKEVEDYNRKPISEGMSQKTKSLLLTNSDDEEDSSSDEEEEEVTEMSPKKRKEKLTKAMRNKQKRHRALQKELEERKRTKKLMNRVSEVKRYQKEIKKHEQESKERKEMVQLLKKDNERTLGKGIVQAKTNPQNVPTIPVGLTDELKSSLRSIKPKGSLLVDRLESFRDRQMVDADPKDQVDKKKVVQGKRRVKVKGHGRRVTGPKAVKKEDGRDFLLMA